MNFAHLSTELVNSLRRKASPSQSGQCEEPGIIPVLHKPIGYQLLDLSFGHHGVLQVQAAVFPLHWAVYVKGIAQPVIGRTSVWNKK